MKIGVVLLCRYSSSRLPGKIMRTIDGKPIIDYIVERILSVIDKEYLCIATSLDSSDDIIQDYCDSYELKCYRGSLQDVAGRFLNAALHHQWDYAVRINGDNFFVETNVMRYLIGLARTGQYDFLSNTHNKTFPQGMSVEVVRTEFFQEAYKKFNSKDDFEHVTFFLHHNTIGNYLFYDNDTYPDAGKLKFAIDEKKDFDLCERIFQQIKDSPLNYNMAEIVHIYKNLQNE